MMENPYRPGAGHMPPFLAGRDGEQTQFRSAVRDLMSENLVITGLRGVGKTVLVESLKEIAEEENWLWVGNDLSESSSLTEDRLAIRILTDIAVTLDRHRLTRPANGNGSIGFVPSAQDDAGSSTFDALKAQYDSVPGLPSDKLKAVLQRCGTLVAQTGCRGVIFAYDESQCLSDQSERNEFPLSMLVETFQSLQKSDATSNFMLVLCGLPQLFDALTKARTYTERMFRVMMLERLSRRDTLEALMRPLSRRVPPLQPTRDLVEEAADLTGGYPYLIQFFGKELVDALITSGGAIDPILFPSPDSMRRLDQGLFAARWNRTTDKQRDFLKVVAELNPCENGAEFTAGDIAKLSANCGPGAFTNAYATQMLHGLVERGVVYKTRHGHFAFTLPMSSLMIKRRIEAAEMADRGWRRSATREDIDHLMERYVGEGPAMAHVQPPKIPTAAAPAATVKPDPPQVPATTSALTWDFGTMRPG